jgi:hypothetical protein
VLATGARDAKKSAAELSRGRKRALRVGVDDAEAEPLGAGPDGAASAEGAAVSKFVAGALISSLASTRPELGDVAGSAIGSGVKAESSMSSTWTNTTVTLFLRLISEGFSMGMVGSRGGRGRWVENFTERRRPCAREIAGARFPWKSSGVSAAE